MEDTVGFAPTTDLRHTRFAVWLLRLLGQVSIMARKERLERSVMALEAIGLPVNRLAYIYIKWGDGWDLNPQQPGPQPRALPIELPPQYNA